MTIAVIGHARVPPGALAAARTAMRTMIEATRAEPGCLAYALAEDVLEPGLIRISELWESREHLAAHFTTPHMAAWRTVLGEAGITEREVNAYKIAEVEPI